MDDKVSESLKQLRDSLGSADEALVLLLLQEVMVSRLKKLHQVEMILRLLWGVSSAISFFVLVWLDAILGLIERDVRWMVAGFFLTGVWVLVSTVTVSSGGGGVKQESSQRQRK